MKTWASNKTYEFEFGVKESTQGIGEGHVRHGITRYTSCMLLEPSESLKLYRWYCLVHSCGYCLIFRQECGQRRAANLYTINSSIRSIRLPSLLSVIRVSSFRCFEIPTISSNSKSSPFHQLCYHWRQHIVIS